MGILFYQYDTDRVYPFYESGYYKNDSAVVYKPLGEWLRYSRNDYPIVSMVLWLLDQLYASLCCDWYYGYYLSRNYFNWIYTD